MTRGTFANVRIKNLMVPGMEGGVTKFIRPGGEQMSIFDAAMSMRKRRRRSSFLPGTNTAPARAAIGRRKARDC